MMMKSMLLTLALSLLASEAMAVYGDLPVPGCKASRWLGDYVNDPELARLKKVIDAATAANPADPALAVQTAKLANGWFSNGRLQQGEPLFEAALMQWERSGAAPDKAIAQSLSYMAEVAYCRKEIDKAEQLYLRALDAWEKLAVPGARRSIFAMRSLAGFYYQQGRFAEGEALFLRSNELAVANGAKPAAKESLWANEKVVEKYRAGDAAGALALAQAEVQSLENEVRSQQELFERQSAQFKASYPEEQVKPGTDKPSYEAIQRKNAALRALRDVEGKLLNRKLALALALNAQGELHHARGQFAQAEPLYLRSQALLTEMDHTKSLNHGRILSDLGLLYRARGENAKAVAFQTQALEVFLPVLGAEHPDVIECEAELAFLRTARSALVKPLIRQAP